MLLQTLAEHLQASIIGDANVDILSVSAPDNAQINTITVANSKNFLNQALESDVSAIVVETAPEQTIDRPLLIVENCQLALITLLNLFFKQKSPKPSIHPSAVISENSQVHSSAEIGANVVIGEHCIIHENVIIQANTVLGDNITVGKNSHLHPNVTIYNDSSIGENTIIHAGCVIGSDGFGYHFDGKTHLKLQHIGDVEIGSNVEIGANTAIDRATLGTTKIGDDTKIDNLVQIAHNVTLGKNNILCAFSGVAGSVTAGDNVIFAADAGAGDHVTIEDNVTIGPRTGIPSKKRLSSGTTWLGNPARPADKAIEQIVSMQRIPGMKKQLKSLQQKLKELEEKL